MPNKKRRTTAQIFENIEEIANILPSPLYWLDTKGIILGANDVAFKLVGGWNMRDKIIGQEHHNFYPKEVAETLVNNNNKVIQRGETVEFEEVIVDITTNKTKYLLSIRSPLRDDDGEIIGIIGTSIDITDKKTAERLTLENQAYMIRAQEDAKSRKIVNQVVHDIRSPVTTMQMILQHCEIQPEHSRVALNKSAAKIQDIANNLLYRFHGEKQNQDLQADFKREVSLISADIVEIISEKKFEYNQLLINFSAKITPAGSIAFINMDVKAFRRMMSNLINNAVDAMKNDADGVVVVHLDVVDNMVKIIIEDNGSGMSASVKSKLLNNIQVTEGKKNGYGIGFGQIRDTLNNNEGKFDIISEPGQGTQIILTFPRMEAPEWICSSITLEKDDLIIILDDDPSIHGAWDARFENVAPGLQYKHFEQGAEAINFINHLSDSEKKHIYLLTDYELMQGMNGLDVISQAGVKRSVLVTSHYNNEIVREKASKSNTKILPKPLAAEVEITVFSEKEQEKLKKVDLVIIDDDENLVSALKALLSDKKVDTYLTAKSFIDNMSDYAIDNTFLIDNRFKNEPITGIDLAKKLHNIGFSDLYLYSGWEFDDDDLVPKFLKMIEKTDIDAIKRLADKS